MRLELPLPGTARKFPVSMGGLRHRRYYRLGVLGAVCMAFGVTMWALLLLLWWELVLTAWIAVWVYGTLFWLAPRALYRAVRRP